MTNSNTRQIRPNANIPLKTVVSNNFTVNQIIKKIKKIKKNIKITYINSAIMNQLSYHVDKKKLSRRGLFLNSNLDRDIENTLNLFENIKK